MTRRLAKALALIVAITVGCGSDPPSPSASSTDGRYAVLRSEGWTLQEAVDLRPDDPLVSVEEPPLDWYAEYHDSTSSQLVRVSGHETSAEDTRTELEAVGFVFDGVDVEGWSTVGGAAPDDPAGPVVLILSSEARSLVVLSYGLDLPELVELIEDLEPADQESWVEAGGILS